MKKQNKFTKEEEEIIEIIENKKNKNIYFIIGTIIFVILIIFGLLRLHRLNREGIIRDELNKINETLEVDEEIKSSGELKYVEEAIKNYYKDYFSYKKIVDETRSDALANLLTPKYLNDNRKNLKKVKEEFKEKNELFQDAIDKMIEMFEDYKILSYLDKEEVNDANYSFYKELMITKEDKIVLENIKEFKETNKEKYDYLIELVDLLNGSSSSWYVKDDNLYIDTDYTLKKYNELRTRIFNLDKSREI